jgi:hypothetical protein
LILNVVTGEDALAAVALGGLKTGPYNSENGVEGTTVSGTIGRHVSLRKKRRFDLALGVSRVARRNTERK